MVKNNVLKRKQVINNLLLGKISMNRKKREGILKYSKKVIESLHIVSGGAKVQVTGHRSGHRLQATGHRSGYRPQVTDQVTGHTKNNRTLDKTVLD